MNTVSSLSILNVPISLVDPDTVKPAIEQLLQTQPQVFIATPNPEHIMLAQKDREFMDVLQHTDLNIPDGTGVVWALRRSLNRAMEGQAVKENPSLQKRATLPAEGEASGEILPPTTHNLPPTTISRVTGIDLMYQLCQLAAGNSQPSQTSPFPKENGRSVAKNQEGLSAQPNSQSITHNSQLTSLRVGLLGGSKGVAAKAAQNLTNQIPGLDIIALPDYTYGEKDTEIIQKIRDERISVLFVALGAPKQELFIHKHIQTMSNVRLAMGVGGALDVFAGKLRRPPQWAQNCNLEWLYRLVQEPWRWKRQLSLIRFALKVLT